MIVWTNPPATQKVIWTLESARAVVSACDPFVTISRRADVAAMLKDFANGEVFAATHDQTLVALTEACSTQIVERLPAYAEILDQGLEESCSVLDPSLQVSWRLLVAIGRFKRMRDAAWDHLRAEKYLCGCRNGHQDDQ